MRKSWLIACITNFLIAATMGLLLRFTMVFPIGINYQYFIHAHSHTAMFGWVYLMLFCFIVHHFVPPCETKNYNTLFWLTQGAVVGMMLSFPFQGYGLFSIAFSSLHIILSYVFTFRIWNAIKATTHVPRKLLRTALVFMAVSTIGAWSLGILANIVGKQSPLYKSAIQFFLHFQLNGWFVFGVLAIFFAILVKSKVTVSAKRFNLFYGMLLFSTVFTWALPLSWYYPMKTLVQINAIGVGLQVMALVLFLFMVLPKLGELTHSYPRAAKGLLFLSLLSFSLKIIIQAATSFPMIAVASHNIRNLAIGFIHFAMLGLISGFLFYFLAASKIVGTNLVYWRIGIASLYIGFILTEIMLFVQGLLTYMKLGSIDNAPIIMLGASVLLPAGIALLLLQLLRRERIS